jgi:hypothetical protein
LNKGDQVIIRQERGQWYRIVAPATARAYIFAEYVRVDAGGEVAADSAPPPINPSIDLSQGQPDATGRLKLSENDRRAAALKEAYFRRIQDQFARDEESQNLVAERIFDSLGELEARIKAIDEEVASRISYPMAATDLGSAAWAPPDPLSGGYTGWVENIGRVGGAPASFRLSKGGEIRFYLRSDRFSLADFAGRRVWVNGNIEPSPSGNILNVDQIRILSDQEIAEGLRQYSGVQYPLAAGSGEYADPRLSASVIPQYQPLPVIPSDPSMLPDVVESTGQSYQFAPELRGGEGGVIIDSQGEVKTDYYEAPNISDIGPE